MNKHPYGLYFSFLACLLLSLLYAPPFDLGISDKEIFTYTGWAISKGLVPYRDFFDHKPPLIYFIHFAGILLGGAWGLWTINTILALATTGVFFNCCRRYNLTFPWLLPLLLNLMTRDPLISEGINMTREYTSWFFILFFCVLMGRSRYRYPGLGLLTGLIFFMQQDQVLPLLPFLAYVLLSADPMPVMRRLLLMASGFLAILLPILFYFVLHRSLGYFLDDAFLFNLHVYTTERKSMGDHFRTIKRVLDAGNYELPFMVAFCLGITALFRENKKRGLIAAAFAAFLLTLAAEFMGGRFKGQPAAVDYYYYFIPLSAGVCVLLFTIFAFAAKTAPANPGARLPYVLLLCSSLAYTALQHAAHLPRRDQDPVINSPELNYLRQHRPGNYQLYVFGDDDYIAAYYEFRILSPSPWLYPHFWFWYREWDADGRILRSIGQDLLRHHTTYVIMDPARVVSFRNPENYRWWMSFMMDHYEPLAVPGSTGTILWRLKNG